MGATPEVTVKTTLIEDPSTGNFALIRVHRVVGRMQAQAEGTLVPPATMVGDAVIWHKFYHRIV